MRERTQLAQIPKMSSSSAPIPDAAAAPVDDFEERQRAARERVEAFERAQKEKKEIEQAEKLAARYQALQAKREETMKTVEAFQKEETVAATGTATNNGSSAEEFAAKLMGSGDSTYNDDTTEKNEDNKAEPPLKRLSTRELAEQQKKEKAAKLAALEAKLAQEEADRLAKLQAVWDKKEQYRLERERNKERAREQQRLEQQQIAENSINQTRANMKELAAMAQEQNDRLLGLQNSFAASKAAAEAAEAAEAAARDSAPSRPKRNSSYVGSNGSSRRDLDDDDDDDNEYDSYNPHLQQGNSNALKKGIDASLQMMDTSSSSAIRRPKRHSTYIEVKASGIRPDMDWSDKHHVAVATRRASTAGTGTGSAMQDYSFLMDTSNKKDILGGKKSKIDTGGSISSSKRRNGRKGVRRQRSSSLSDMGRAGNRSSKREGSSAKINKLSPKAAAKRKTMAAYDMKIPDMDWSSFHENATSDRVPRGEVSKTKPSNDHSRRNTLAVPISSKSGDKNTINEDSKRDRSRRGRDQSVGRGRSRSRSRSRSSRVNTTGHKASTSLLDSGSLSKQQKSSGKDNHRRRRSRSLSASARGRKSTQDRKDKAKDSKTTTDDSSPPPLTRDLPKRGINRQRSSSLSELRPSRGRATTRPKKKDDKENNNGGTSDDADGPSAIFDWIAHSKDAITNLESKKAALEARRKEKKEKRKEMQQLEVRSRKKKKSTAETKEVPPQNDERNKNDVHVKRRTTEETSSDVEQGTKQAKSVVAGEDKATAKPVPASAQKKEPTNAPIVDLTNSGNNEDDSAALQEDASTPTLIQNPQALLENYGENKEAPVAPKKEPTTHTQEAVESPAIPSATLMDESTMSRDSSKRRGSIFGKVFKRGASKRAMDTSQRDMDTSSGSAHGKDSSRRRGSIFGKAVKNAKALIHRPSEKRDKIGNAKDEHTLSTGVVSNEAKEPETADLRKLTDVKASSTETTVEEHKQEEKAVQAPTHEEVSSKITKKRLSVAATKTANLDNKKPMKTDQGKESKGNETAGLARKNNGADKGAVKVSEDDVTQPKPSKNSATEIAKGKPKNAKKKTPIVKKDAPSSTKTAKSAEPSLKDMVRGQIRAGIKPRPRESVMNFRPTAPKAVDFVEDDYQESPLRLLDTYEDELTLEQLREKIAKLEKQLKETQETESREVEAVVWSGRVMVEQIAQKQPDKVSYLPDDLSAVDEAVRRNNEIIKYLKSENQKRREEQKKIKTSFFDLHHSTMRLEKETEQTLGYLEKLEDVYFQGELDKRKSLFRGLASCREGESKLTDELERRSSFVEFEERIRLLYEGEMQKLLISFDEKYGGTPLAEFLNEIAAGKHDEKLESAIRDDDSEQTEA